jgi:hypothetical protein
MLKMISVPELIFIFRLIVMGVLFTLAGDVVLNMTTESKYGPVQHIDIPLSHSGVLTADQVEADSKLGDEQFAEKVRKMRAAGQLKPNMMDIFLGPIWMGLLPILLYIFLYLRGRRFSYLVGSGFLLMLTLAFSFINAS